MFLVLWKLVGPHSGLVFEPCSDTTCQNPKISKKFKIFKVHIISINAVTNCLISYLLSKFIYWLCLAVDSSFQFTDFVLFATIQKRLSCKKWAYLASELMQRVLPVFTDYR